MKSRPSTNGLWQQHPTKQKHEQKQRRTRQEEHRSEQNQALQLIREAEHRRADSKASWMSRAGQGRVGTSLAPIARHLIIRHLDYTMHFPSTQRSCVNLPWYYDYGACNMAFGLGLIYHVIEVIIACMYVVGPTGRDPCLGIGEHTVGSSMCWLEVDSSRLFWIWVSK